MKASEIRKHFIRFFEEKEHQIVPSAPLVVKNDPTLMFTNAGMNQFKDYFLGNKTPDSKRVADTQKCLRVSGKHNDLEEVGIDTYHHTMFEMLGNWSFGDYFKKEAIEWAWELLTEVYKLPKDRLYITVFEGDASDNLDFDKETYNIWKGIADENHILKASKKDNFWEMGETGPCGPCSEVHIDLRSDEERKEVDGATLVNQDHMLVIEIWNLVFIEFNRLSSGYLQQLPQKHVDTGMGLERLAMAIQGKYSNYDTDLFSGLIEKVSELSGFEYGKELQKDIAFRVIVDHIRAVCFAITDGEIPSNNKAGYVIRRILRRAVRYGYTFLDMYEPFLFKLVDVLAKQFKEVFPELVQQQDFVEKVIQEEEISFLRTLENGLKKLDQFETRNSNRIEGKEVFELYDTYGFPVDLTALIAREKGLEVDEEGFLKEMEIQKNRSKAAASKETGDWTELKAGTDVAFIGYEFAESEAHLLKYRKVSDKKGSFYQVVLDKTPFYAESGGQVGDTGFLHSGDEKIQVLDTQKENDLILHITKELPKDTEKPVHAVINHRRRAMTMNNHSATHLMHAALKQVLGDHVQQRGSFVNDKILRFDFSHFAKMTNEEIREVEDIVNAKIRENIPLDEKRNIPIDDAKAIGATALFGEKYGDYVRVITFDPDYSVELCGGTHVPSTAVIGLFKITSESSIAAGIRRIEAVTAMGSAKYVYEKLDELEKVEEILNNPGDLSKAVVQLLDERNKLQKEVDKMQHEQLGGLRNKLIANKLDAGGVSMIVEKVEIPNADALKKLSFDLKKEVEDIFMVLGAEINGKPLISMIIGDKIVKEKDLNAGELVRQLAREIQGGGGGQPFYATAGGKNAEGLDAVMVEARKIFESYFSVKN